MTSGSELVLQEVEQAVAEAHSRLAPVLDRRLPRVVQSNLVRCAMALRHALALLESERRGVVPPAPAGITDPEQLARFLARSPDIPLKLRRIAVGAISFAKGDPPTERVVFEAHAHIVALMELLGLDRRAAAARLVESPDFAKFPAEGLAHASTLYAQAVRALVGGRP